MANRGDEVKPEEEVHKFLQEFSLCGPRACGLQEHVHQIFREGSDLRGQKKALLQWDYHFCKVWQPLDIRLPEVISESSNGLMIL